MISINSEIKRASASPEIEKGLAEKIISSMKDGFVILDHNGTHMNVNKAFCKMTGFTREDLIGAGPPHPYWPEEDQERIKAAFQKTLNEDFEDFELTFKRKTGERFPVIISPSSVYDENHNIVRYFATVKDLSVVKTAEKKVQEARRDWEEIFQAIGHPTMILDPGFNILMANRAMLKVTGLPQKHLQGKKCHQVFHISDSSPKYCPMQKMLDTGRLETSEMEVETLGGVFLVSCTPIYDEKGRLEKIIHIATDTTEQKRAQSDLMQSEQRYRSLVENIFIGIFICDVTQGRFFYLNKRLCDIFGYLPEEGINLSIWDLIPLEEHHMLKKEMNDKLNIFSNFETSYIYTGIRKDGTLIRLKVYTTPVTYEGKPAIQGIVNDVTESENMELRLRQAQKMEAIGTLAGGIAHDFNNILTAIIGFAELAEFRLEDDHKVMRDIKEILKGGYRAKELVNQILAFSRKSEQELKPLYLGPIVKEALKLLRASIPTTIDIRWTIEDNGNVVMADATQIHQVLMNLCTNAAHTMMEEGGIMEVSLSVIKIEKDDKFTHPDLDPGEYLRLTVADTGYGMSPEIMERIFDPYFTTKEKGVGTGMGLAVVHGIVKAYGGSVKVYSEPGKGSVFHVYLPSTQRDDAAETSRKKGPMPTGNERILFIDDEESIVKMGKQALDSLGYSVTARTSSLDALELFRSRPYDFDIIITDMTMPSMSGDKLAIKIREIRPDIPVILCTGYSAKISEERAGDIGINAFIMKPFVPFDLAKTVRNVLNQSLPR